MSDTLISLKATLDFLRQARNELDKACLDDCADTIIYTNISNAIHEVKKQIRNLEVA